MIKCIDLHKSYSLTHGTKRVLEGITMSINKGEKVGLLGRNGAGKTTLVKLIAGVELPTSGKVIRKMSISWPLGFGGGFQGALTGYDNARFIARIYGRNYLEIRDFVEDFSELGSQLKSPVRVYSSGMKARLAFALSLAIEFDCYLIDEVILVGDQNFQQKCHEELFVKRSDRALILASHSLPIIDSYCNKALVISEGKGHMFEDLAEAEAIYAAL